MLAKFSRVESKRTVFRLRKIKNKKCVVFTYFTKWAREITEVSRRIRVTTVKKCTKKRDARVKLLFFI